MKLKFKLLTPTAQLPTYAHQGDSGMDVRADQSTFIDPRGKATIGTGLAAEIPDGYELQVRPRSGLSSRGILAAFGTVDAGYRGEIRVTLYNLTRAEFNINVGDRIAQLVLAPVTRAEIIEADTLSETERGSNGFGSTGR